MQPSPSTKPSPAEQAPERGPEFGAALLTHARDAINVALNLPRTEAAASAHEFAADGACFVTLRIDGTLRGCIGSLEAHRPLADDIEANARAAALHDPRFPPLSRREWRQTELEVSVLSPIVWQACPTEEAACQWITPFEDGVVLASQGRRATFLPQVWEQLPDMRLFLAELRRKAGLARDHWPADMQVGRYHVTAFSEARP